MTTTDDDTNRPLPSLTSLPIFTPPSGTASQRPAAHSLAGPVTTPGTNPISVVYGNPSLPTTARRPSSPQTPTRPPAPASPPATVGIDWQQVALLRAQAADQLMKTVGEDRGIDPEAERERGRAIIQELLQTSLADRIHDGEPGWSLDQQEALAVAIFDALFELGRLQPLVEDDTVENVIVIGNDPVWLEKTDGTLVKVPPVVETDQELIDFVAFIGSRSLANARSFSPASPRLHMRLPGGQRLAAAAWVTARPAVVIRRHRLRRVSLDDLVGRDMITPVMASFLAAAIKARKSVVVAGPQGAGKTTLVRALCAQINPWEAIGTFETEFELFLHELPDVHPIVHAWEARPGSGEINADGSSAGEFTIDQALYDSFRFNLSRQIVGEVRGREVWAMIKAMESGSGSISTTHARTADAAFRKLVTCAMETGPQATEDLVTSKLAETIDLIVQVHLETVAAGHGKWRRSRWVSEILHIAPGEQLKGYATTRVFRPNPAGGPAIPGTLPDDLRELERYGFNSHGYYAEAQQEDGSR